MKFGLTKAWQGAVAGLLAFTMVGSEEALAQKTGQKSIGKEVSAEVFFKQGSSNLDKEAQETLKWFAKAVSENGGCDHIDVTGDYSPEGSRQANKTVSTARAFAVVNNLESKVGSIRVVPYAYGDVRTVFTDEPRYNRRAVVVCQQWPHPKS